MFIEKLVFVVVMTDLQHVEQVRTSPGFCFLSFGAIKAKANGYIQVLSDKNVEVVRLLLCWQDSEVHMASIHKELEKNCR